MTDEVAINVKDEAADTFYNHWSELPKEVKSRVSLHMLENIFKKMVVPAIDRVRALDREGRDAN